MPPLNNLQRSCLALAVTQALLVSEGHANTIEVNANCTLRQAILTANVDFPAAGDCGPGSGADIIEIPTATPISYLATTYNYGGTDSMLPTINTDITIQSTAVGGTLIERPAAGAANFRIFAVTQDARLALDGITVKNGFAPSGGGIYVKEGELQLTNSTVTGNSATVKGGGISISEYSDFTMTDSTISLNNSSAAHAGIYAYRPDSFVVTDSTVSNNTATTFSGGIGINAYGSVATIDGGEISDNMSSTAGGGVYVYDVQLTMTSVTMQNNSAQYGAAIYANDATVNIIAGSTQNNSATDSGGAFQIKAQSTLNLTDTSVMSNQAINAGGAICLNDSVLNIDSSNILSNSATAMGSKGGAIYALQGSYSSQVIIKDSSVSGNTAETGGAIESTIDDLQIERSTFADNTAGDTAAAISQDGAAFFMRNSTLSGNQAVQSTALKLGNSVSKIYNSTIYNNIASGVAPAAAVNAQGSLTIWNSVIGGNTGADCYLPGPIVNNSSWFEDATCDGSAAGKPLLNPLGDNNEGLPGTTLTHAPALSSPLLSGGNTNLCGDSENPDFQQDQRGAARGTASCTIGAVEGGIAGEFDVSCFVIKAAGNQVITFCL